MGLRLVYVVFCLFMWPLSSADLDEMYTDVARDEKWMSDVKRSNDEACLHIRPTNRDIIKRFYAILPYFDKEHSNSAFLRKFRGTVYGMSDGEDLLDKEAAFYAAVLTPVIFLQNYRDTWCLLERFHRALRLYQVSHPTEKRSALKLLQNYRAVNHKVKSFIWDLPGPLSPPRPRTTSDIPEVEEDDLHDKKDIRYVKELIKNLG